MVWIRKRGFFFIYAARDVRYVSIIVIMFNMEMASKKVSAIHSAYLRNVHLEVFC